MGYYNGSGVKSAGGAVHNILRQMVDSDGMYTLRQTVTTETLRRSGVSLAVAQAAVPTQNLHGVYGGYGNLAWCVGDCVGTKTSVAYSQIGDSSLYDLTITTETMTVDFYRDDSAEHKTT